MNTLFVKIVRDDNSFTFKVTGYPDVFVKYPFSIRDTPQHILNYMVGIILSEIITWKPVEAIKFSQLTEREMESIQDHICLHIKCNSYDMVVTKHIQVLVDEVVSDSDRDKVKDFKQSTILICNGMGKDGLSGILSVNDLFPGSGLGCTVVGQFKKVLMDSRRKLMASFYKESGTRGIFIDTNFTYVMIFKIIPWHMFLIPLCYTFKTNVILSIFGYEQGKWDAAYLPIRPLIHPLSYYQVTDVTGITIGNPFWGLTVFGTQYLMAKIYEKYLGFQRSCIKADGRCRKCTKCRGIEILLGAMKYSGKNYSYDVSYLKHEDYFNGYGLLTREVDIECAKVVLKKTTDSWCFHLYKQAHAWSWEPLKYRKYLIDCGFKEIDTIDENVPYSQYKNQPRLWSDVRDSRSFWR